MVAGKVEIARIEHRRGAGQALQHRGFEIVDHDFGRHATERREGVFVGGEETPDDGSPLYSWRTSRLPLRGASAASAGTSAPLLKRRVLETAALINVLSKLQSTRPAFPKFESYQAAFSSR